MVKVLKVKMSGQRIKYEVMKVSFKDSDLMKAKRWKWDSKGSIYCTENRLDILRTGSNSLFKYILSTK